MSAMQGSGFNRGFELIVWIVDEVAHAIISLYKICSMATTQVYI
jgi:hypothetical protein